MMLRSRRSLVTLLVLASMSAGMVGLAGFAVGLCLSPTLLPDAFVPRFFPAFLLARSRTSFRRGFEIAILERTCLGQPPWIHRYAPQQTYYNFLFYDSPRTCEELFTVIERALKRDRRDPNVPDVLKEFQL